MPIRFHPMKAWLAGALIAGLTPNFAAAAEAPLPLLREAAIPLARVTGRIDHLAIDLPRKHLFVAELGNGSVDAIDLASGKVIHRFLGLDEPQGIVYVPDADVIAVACGGDGSVRFYRGSDFSALGEVRLGDDADNLRVDPRNGRIVVGYGNGALGIIDVTKRTKIADVRLPGHPESFQLDSDTGRAFVNVPDADQIALVDLAAGKQIARWTVRNARSNFPMAFDSAGNTLAVIFRAPPRIALLNAATGTAMQPVPTCGDADDVFFDTKRQRYYVSCGSGAVDVFARDSSGLHHIGSVNTSFGARTSLFVPELDRLYVAERAGLFGSTADILVLRPAP